MKTIYKYKMPYYQNNVMNNHILFYMLGNIFL